MRLAAEARDEDVLPSRAPGVAVDVATTEMSQSARADTGDNLLQSYMRVQVRHSMLTRFGFHVP